MAEKGQHRAHRHARRAKSTLGIVLAKILNYDFIDADLVIQNSCDKTLQKLIDACGPEGFIQVENEILRELNCVEVHHRHGRLGRVLRRGHEASRRDRDHRVSEDHVRPAGQPSERPAGARRGAEGRHRHEPARAVRRVVCRCTSSTAEVTVDVNDLSITAAARKVADALKASVIEK